jgi:hypothetical protein
MMDPSGVVGVMTGTTLSMLAEDGGVTRRVTLFQIPADTYLVREETAHVVMSGCERVCSKEMLAKMWCDQQRVWHNP